MVERATSLEMLGDYPGRFLVLGKDSFGYDVVVYGITGRSPSSQNRELVVDRNIIKTAVHDEDLGVGNSDLTIYNAFRFVNRGSERVFTVSNGRQTDPIAEYVRDNKPDLLIPFQSWPHEPDGLKTPRIAGIIVPNGSPKYYLGMARYKEGVLCNTEHKVWTFKDNEVNFGKGLYIATYQGEVDSPQAFDSDPIEVPIYSASIYNFWDAMNADRRVALLVGSSRPQDNEIYIDTLDRWGNEAEIIRSLN